MSSAHEINIQKDNFIKSKAPLYFSPDSNKKHNFTNLYTEPRNIYQERDSNLLKNPLMSKNKSNYQLQNNFEKHTKLNTDKPTSAHVRPLLYALNGTQYVTHLLVSSISI